MKPFIRYAGGHLDRAGLFRKDEDWISAKLAHPKTQIVPVWRSKNLVDDLSSAPKSRVVDRADASEILELAHQTTLLGISGDVAYFAADISSLEEEPAHALVNQGDFVDLRQVGPLLGADIIFSGLALLIRSAKSFMSPALCLTPNTPGTSSIILKSKSGDK